MTRIDTPKTDTPERAGRAEFEGMLKRRIAAYTAHAERFRDIFGVPLRPFYPNHLLGLDLPRLDEAVIGSGDKEIARCIVERFGDEALSIVKALL